MAAKVRSFQILTGDIACGDCGYFLQGLEARMRCPECGQRVRRSLAALRLRAWRGRRPSSPAIFEGKVGCTVGMFTLLITLAVASTRPTVRDPVSFVVAGIGVGFCFTMLQSSVRSAGRTHSSRRRWRELATVIALGIPTMLATVIWVLMVLSLVIQYSGDSWSR
jgi:hypothetical protein